MRMIRTVAANRQTEDTPESLVERICGENSMVTVTARLATELFAALRPELKLTSFWNGKRQIVVVTNEIFEDEFTSYREAVVSYFGH